MEIIYSAGARLGGFGFGYTAYNISSRLHQKIPLKRIIALTLNKKVCDPKDVSTLFLFGGLLEKCPSQILKDNIFDLYASLKIEKCDVFHGWSDQALFSIRKAKHFNAVTVVERASTHILKQKRLIDDGYKKYGVRKQAIPSAVINKCLKEFQEVDYICVPSTFAYESFLEYGVDKRKMILLPYGVDLERFTPGRKKDEIFRVLYVGLLSFRKGVQHLLAAWSKLGLKNAQLVLAGPTLGEFKGVFTRYANLSNIKYVGFAKDIVSLYRESSILVLPSIEDGFGLVVLEAMASGIPALVSQNVGAKDCLTDAEDGFIVPAQDTDAIIERIDYLYRNQQKLKEMGQAARLKAQGYPWEKTADNLANIYSQIC